MVALTSSRVSSRCQQLVGRTARRRAGRTGPAVPGPSGPQGFQRDGVLLPGQDAVDLVAGQAGQPGEDVVAGPGRLVAVAGRAGRGAGFPARPPRTGGGCGRRGRGRSRTAAASVPRRVSGRRRPGRPGPARASRHRRWVARVQPPGMRGTGGGPIPGGLRPSLPQSTYRDMLPRRQNPSRHAAAFPLPEPPPEPEPEERWHASQGRRPYFGLGLGRGRGLGLGLGGSLELHGAGTEKSTTTGRWSEPTSGPTKRL